MQIGSIFWIDHFLLLNFMYLSSFKGRWCLSIYLPACFISIMDFHDNLYGRYTVEVVWKIVVLVCAGLLWLTLHNLKGKINRESIAKKVCALQTGINFPHLFQEGWCWKSDWIIFLVCTNMLYSCTLHIRILLPIHYWSNQSIFSR
jgi:hypothetical protein